MLKGSESTLKVLVRVRPLPVSQSGQSSSSGVPCLTLGSEAQSISLARQDKKGAKKSDFVFSSGAVLGPDAEQHGVFEHCNVVGDVLEGVDCCIMAYGQTGSGKTHSMYGRGWEGEVQRDELGNTLNSSSTISMVPEKEVPALLEGEGSEEQLGVVPRSVTELFANLEEKASQIEGYDFNVSCQILQIYNERIYDLLGDKRRENPLQLREGAKTSKHGGVVQVSLSLRFKRSFRGYYSILVVS